MKEKIKGINLGNWLVLEKWMDGTPFKDTVVEDEAWLARDLDRMELQERLKRHRDTFITEQDFKTISYTYRLNTVRIPVPYFIFGDREPFVGCIEYLDKAFEWANKYKLKVIIDLHTAPFGQNGYDNGGIMGVCRFHKEPREVRYVLSVLQRLAQRYGSDKALFGIEVLNEPIGKLAYMTSPTKNSARDKREAYGSSGIPLSFLKRFYIVAYRKMRKYLPLSKAIIFHDSFRLDSWKDFFVRNGMKNVYIDAHFYLSAMEGFIPFHNRAFVSVINKLNPIRIVDKFIKCNIHSRVGCRHKAKLIYKKEINNECESKVSQSKSAEYNNGTGLTDNDDFMQATGNIIPYNTMFYHKLYIAIEKLRIKLASRYTPLIIGEWCVSVSYSNDTIYNYRNKVNRILHTDYNEREFAKIVSESDELKRIIGKEKRRRYRLIERLQLSAWNMTAGNVYWSYKIAHDSEHPENMHWKRAWDYRRCKKNGWIK